MDDGPRRDIMATLAQVLAGLIPSATHDLTQSGSTISLLVLDGLSSAVAQRTIAIYQRDCHEVFRVVVLSAVNELRGRSCLDPLDALPDWE